MQGDLRPASAASHHQRADRLVGAGLPGCDGSLQGGRHVGVSCGRRVAVRGAHVTVRGLHAPADAATDEQGGRDRQARRDSLDEQTTGGIEVRRRRNRVDEDTKLLDVIRQEEADHHHGEFTARPADFSSRGARPLFCRTVRSASTPPGPNTGMGLAASRRNLNRASYAGFNTELLRAGLMFRRLSTVGVFTGLLLLGGNKHAAAQSGANVLVVINDASEPSRTIAEYYARKRAVPATNICHITTSIEDTIERVDFDRQIQGPAARCISAMSGQDRILYIVLTKGVPIRIQGTSSGREGTVSSVDSELTLLYRRQLGVNTPIAGPLPNPY